MVLHVHLRMELGFLFFMALLLFDWEYGWWNIKICIYLLLLDQKGGLFVVVLQLE